MIEGIDCASTLSALTIARLRLSGKKFVLRYLTGRYALTAAEVRALKLARMDLVCIFEEGANRALAGMLAGKQDALTANDALNKLGLHGAPVYFACDFDATPGDQTNINNYLRGASSILGQDRVGIYGGYWPVSRAATAKVCRYFWQTYAWSGANHFAGAHLLQYRNGVPLAGIQVDLDRALQADYGQVSRPKPPPQPVPVPKPAPKPQPAPSPSDEAYIYMRNKDGSVHYEHLTARGAQIRFEDWKAGHFQELRFKRK